MKTKWSFLIVLALLITLVSGATPARAQSETTYSISGQVFEDDNGNGILDGAEYFTYYGHTVQLDQGCDGTVDAAFTVTYYVQTYTFANLPAGQSYCIRYDYPGYRTTSPNPVTNSLTGNMTGVNIGFEEVRLKLSVSPPIEAPVNEYFERTISVTGGDAPYTFTAPVTAPAPGLTAAYNSDGSIFISGTPTQAGEYSFVVDVTDGNGAHKQVTVTLWVQDMPVFEFTTMPDPWAAGDEVTFTFGLVNPDHLKFMGSVTLYAGGTPIQDCREPGSDPDADPSLILYDYYGTGWGFKNPVTCTTTLDSLETITATYTAASGAFLSASATLAAAQSAVITIGPDALPNATYATTYSQQLTATGGVGPYTFSLGSTNLGNFTVSSTGVLSGTPISGNPAGSYTLLINVTDASGGTGSRTYTLVVDKVAPTMTVEFYALNPPPYYYGQTFVVYASLLDPSNSLIGGGTVTYSVDGSPISGCIDLIPNGNQAQCHITQSLSVGAHTITAAYTPGGFAANYYLSTSGSITTSIVAGSYAIPGVVFKDDDQNGARGGSEWSLVGQVVSVSTCDGTTLIATDITDGYGQFLLENVPGGECVRVSTTPQKGWTQTTDLPDYILSRYNYINPYIGVYNTDEVNITFSPSYSLPTAGVGHGYSQAITASGGTAPYTYTKLDGSLPDGLTFSSDGTISGTPIAAGKYEFTVRATDASDYTGLMLYEIEVQQWIDGIYNLTSDHNPSTPGQTVTFTFSGTSESYDPEGEPILPLGAVKFQADGTDIPGCEQVYLNYDFTYYTGFGDYPATCATGALAAGDHTITASFTPYNFPFGPETRSLTQTILPHLFTWTSPILEGGTGTFTAALPEGATIEEWSRSSIPGGSTCDQFIESSQGVTSVEIPFGASGDYQVCLYWRLGNDYHTDQQTVTVQNVAPVAVDWATSVYPEPSMAGFPILEAVAAFFDWDDLASCTVNYGDGSGDLTGTADNSEHVCIGPAHTYTAAGTYTVTFTAADTEGASGTSTISHTVIPGVQADLSLTKTDSKDPVKPGASLVYTLMVSNLGPNTAESVVLSDKLDSNTTYVSTSAPKGWKCSYAANSATVTCTSASLASGGSAIIKITVTVNKTAKVGKELVNTALVSSTTHDPETGNNTVTQKTMVSK